jgi:hypothetical protein
VQVELLVGEDHATAAVDVASEDDRVLKLNQLERWLGRAGAPAGAVANLKAGDADRKRQHGDLRDDVWEREHEDDREHSCEDQLLSAATTKAHHLTSPARSVFHTHRSGSRLVTPPR